MDIVHAVVCGAVSSLHRKLSATIFTLETFLCGVVSFTADHFSMIDKNQRSILFFINQTKLFIETKSNTDGIQRKPFTVTLNFLNIKRNNDVANLTGQAAARINGFETEHYYYTCQKRRTEHACDKKNIRRDVIEPAVAQAIKMYCLTDDVIEWMADRTVEYWEKHDNDLQIEALEQQLEENKKATSNMLKAIEMGIITEATRTRMVELETEQSRLSVQLNAAKEDVVKIDREQIISYLELLQQGDIHDRDFQMELFKNFLVAVYVYDDNRMKLVFSCMGDQNSVEIPLETGEDPPDGGLSPDAKMFVLTPDSSTKKAPYFV